MQENKYKVTLLLDRTPKGYKGLSYSYLKAFEKNNYDCNIVAFDVGMRSYSIARFFPKILSEYLLFKQKRILDAIKKQNNEFVFVVKGFYLLPETIDKIKEMGMKVCCFYPDDPFSPDAGSSNDFVKKSISRYDAYFTWSRKLISPLKEAGCKNVFYLPFAADPDLFKPPENDNFQRKHAVSFVGNADKERMEFIGNLSAQLRGWNEKKALFGHEWKDIDGFECKGVVYGDDFLNSIYHTKINLNILRKQNKGSHNMRTFDIPAAGGFMLHEYSEEAAGFFKEGVEAEFFHDAAECADKIKYYFKNDDLRNKVAKAGYEKIFSAGYTYSNLVTVIEEKIKSIK